MKTRGNQSNTKPSGRAEAASVLGREAREGGEEVGEKRREEREGERRGRGEKGEEEVGGGEEEAAQQRWISRTEELDRL